MRTCLREVRGQYPGLIQLGCVLRVRQGEELLHGQVLLGVLPLRLTTLCEWPTDFIGTNIEDHPQTR